MIPNGERFEIVCAIDLSEYSDTVLEHACDEAIRHDRAAMHVITVVPEHHGWWHRPTDDERARVEAEARQRLGAIASRVLDDAVPAERRDDWRVRLHVRRGHADEQIAMLASEVLADLIVIGRFGQSARRRRGIGSVADRVVAFADCPVLVVQLARDTTAAARQCPDCVAVRAASDGDRWFCDRHQSDSGYTMLLPFGSSRPVGGGPMW
jgi:nucleotide-binding universal stress UspA family protein